MRRTVIKDFDTTGMTCQVDGGPYVVSVTDFMDGVHYVARNGRYTFRVRAVNGQPAHPIELMVAQEGVHQPPTARDCDVALETMPWRARDTQRL